MKTKKSKKRLFVMKDDEFFFEKLDYATKIITRTSAFKMPSNHKVSRADVVRYAIDCLIEKLKIDLKSS